MRFITGVGLVLLMVACSKSNNLVLGRVTMQLADHTVVVTDCYRTSVPPASRTNPSAPSSASPPSPRPPVFHWAPCRDADITIRESDVVVNGRTYGPLKRGDSITVDHGKVLIADSEAKETP